MPIDINIPDTDLQGFNSQAQTELKKGVKEYVDDLIAESNRIEASRNTTSNGPEITSSIVKDAQVIIRHKISRPKKSWGKVIIKILASSFSFISGILYQQDKLQDSTYLVFYIVVIALAILFSTLMIIQED